MQSKFTIRPERPTDADGVQTVLRGAFPTDDEARLVAALHEGGHALVSLVAETQGQIVGHILFSEMKIETDHRLRVPAVNLAPVAVLPEQQRRGIGGELIREGLKACRAAGHRIVLVLGHAEYYPRFGFSAALAARLRSPFPPEYFMALELALGALDGVSGTVRYPPPFGI